MVKSPILQHAPGHASCTVDADGRHGGELQLLADTALVK